MCSPAELCSPINTNQINGPGIEEDGIDVSAEYSFDDVLGGALTLGLDATYTLSFEVDPLVVEGVQVSPAFDGAGFSNVNTGYTPLPELKGSVFIDWNRGNNNLRAVVRYIDTRSLLDPTRNIFTPRGGNVSETGPNEGPLASPGVTRPGRSSVVRERPVHPPVPVDRAGKPWRPGIHLPKDFMRCPCRRRGLERYPFIVLRSRHDYGERHTGAELYLGDHAAEPEALRSRLPNESTNRRSAARR